MHHDHRGWLGRAWRSPWPLDHRFYRRHYLPACFSALPCRDRASGPAELPAFLSALSPSNLTDIRLLSRSVAAFRTIAAGAGTVCATGFAVCRARLLSRSLAAEIRTIAAGAGTVHAAGFAVSCAGLQNLLPAPAAIIKLAVGRPRIRLGEFVPDSVVVILHAAPVIGIMLPFFPDRRCGRCWCSDRRRY